jgi:hypothetical protein
MLLTVQKGSGGRLALRRRGFERIDGWSGRRLHNKRGHFARILDVPLLPDLEAKNSKIQLE